MKTMILERKHTWIQNSTTRPKDNNDGNQDCDACLFLL